MKLYYDEKVDALYIRLDNSNIIESEEVKDGIVLDYNQNEQVVGIEILNISKRVSLPELKKVQLDFA
ncbi:MAG: DUF2283 domain-containing protein [Melioribacteraceae bacterium]|nr:DUF2283 domain-containing protein [Saprospiraceae bacterium]MCF8355770.1 DUF2283 domain-containing protein [Melioribacteraceae bacterium]MCF8394798.1 DUF2283 domain-containing protein [Melioribacteraceae bacterium]